MSVDANGNPVADPSGNGKVDPTNPNPAPAEFKELSAEEVTALTPEQKTAYEAKKAESDLKKTVPYGALHEEREKRKEAEARIAQYEAEKAKVSEKEKKAQEAELAKKGEFETLLTQKTSEFEAYKTQAKAEIEVLKKEVEQYRVKTTANVDALKAKIPEDKKALILSLLEGKSLAEQELLLPQLMESFSGVKPTVNAPVGNAKPPVTEEIDVLLKKEANGTITPIERITLMNLYQKKG